MYTIDYLLNSYDSSPFLFASFINVDRKINKIHYVNILLLNNVMIVKNEIRDYSFMYINSMRNLVFYTYINKLFMIFHFDQIL